MILVVRKNEGIQTKSAATLDERRLLTVNGGKLRVFTAVNVTDNM